MALVTLQDLSIRFRGPALLDHVDCKIETGEKIGLLGRNGTGKTTLMKLIAGMLEPDHGQVILAPDTRVAFLPQEIPRSLAGSVADVISAGVPADDPAPAWQRERRVESVLTRMDLNPQAEFDVLSTGMKRRVLLARAFARGPNLLLLDEPTNHLDIESIAWLERFLSGFAGTLLFVTHDRAFLRGLTNRILELDRGRLFDWTCDYDTFLKRKDAWLEAEAKRQERFDKKLAQEERWIRQGIKARRTRNEGRVRALKQLRRERLDRRGNIGSVRMQIQDGQRSGTLVSVLEDVSFRYDQLDVIRELNTVISRGDRVGIMGPNGAGKSTLLRLILGQLQPTQGRVRLGTNLQLTYFDQQREQLDPDKTVQENVADGYDNVYVAGKPKHVIGYLTDFLFTPERARTLVRDLSGGERNRLLLARLFAKATNVLVLDEPTNDLDTETLELLEELLMDFSGTLLLVSHDRTFLNNVVTSTLVFEGEGVVKEYAGGYDDWLNAKALAQTTESAAKPTASSSRSTRDARPRPGAEGPRKRTFREQQELEALPARIEALEAELEALHQEMADPSFYKQASGEISSKSNRENEVSRQIAQAYRRWEELESLRA